MILSVRDFSIGFQREGQDLVAVDGISFDVEAGETFVIIGESGSGKSLTGMSIVGLTPAAARSSGSIRFKQREFVRLAAHPNNEIVSTRICDGTLLLLVGKRTGLAGYDESVGGRDFGGAAGAKAVRNARRGMAHDLHDRAEQTVGRQPGIKRDKLQSPYHGPRDLTDPGAYRWCGAPALGWRSNHQQIEFRQVAGVQRLDLPRRRVVAQSRPDRFGDHRRVPVGGIVDHNCAHGISLRVRHQRRPDGRRSGLCHPRRVDGRRA